MKLKMKLQNSSIPFNVNIKRKYDNIKYITNNVSESFNTLKKLFPKKNNFFFSYYQNYKKKNPNIILITKGELLEFWNKKKKKIQIEEIKALVEYY